MKIKDCKRWEYLYKKYPAEELMIAVYLRQMQLEKNTRGRYHERALKRLNATRSCMGVFSRTER